MRTLLLLLLSIGTLACSTRTEQAGGVPVASFQLKDNSCVNFSEFVSSVELVPLETTEACLIGTLVQLVEHNGCYYIYNREGEMTGRLFEGDEAAHSAISFISSAGNLSVYRDELYFTYHFCDTLYRYADGHFTPFLLVDVGDKFIPPDKVKGVKELKELEAIIKQEKGWYGGILSYYLDDPVSVLTFLDYQYIGYLSLYNRSTGQTLTATHLYDDLLFKGHRFRLKAWKLPKLYKDGVLYYVADPSDLMEAMEDYKRRISAEAWEAFCRERPDVVDQIQRMKEDDNPVLVKLMVKL